MAFTRLPLAVRAMTEGESHHHDPTTRRKPAYSIGTFSSIDGFLQVYILDTRPSVQLLIPLHSVNIKAHKSIFQSYILMGVKYSTFQ